MMPSKSKKQHNFMEAIAHSEKFAKKVGVPMSVGKDFAKADKGRTFRKGGSTSPTEQGINKQKTHHGSMQMPNAMLNKYIGHKDGGSMKSVDATKNPGLAKLPTAVRNKMGYMKKGGMADDSKEDMKMDKKQDVAMIKKAFREHDAQEHKGGKGTNLTLKKGGMTMKKMAMGGMSKETMGPRTMSMDVEKGSNKLTKFGESAVQKRGKTRGLNLGDSGPTEKIQSGAKRMAKGGSASSRADGIASKGKTKGKMC
jgi:hypothetical protein